MTKAAKILSVGTVAVLTLVLVAGCCTRQTCCSKHHLCGPTPSGMQTSNLPEHYRLVVPPRSDTDFHVIGMGTSLAPGEGAVQFSDASCTAFDDNGTWRTLQDLDDTALGETVRVSAIKESYHGFEVFSAKVGVSGNVGSYVSADLGYTHGSKVFYRFDLTKRIEARRRLHQYQKVAESDGNGCDEAARKCGYHYVATLLCGQVSLVQLSEHAFDAEGHVKAGVVTADLNVGIDYRAGQIHQTEGCFLAELKPYALLDTHCPSESHNYVAGWETGLSCLRAGQDLSTCKDANPPELWKGIEAAFQ